MELARSDSTPEFVEYFLDPRHHVPGTPINMASFHFYALPAIGQGLESWQYTVFDQLSGLIREMLYVDAIRKDYLRRHLSTSESLHHVAQICWRTGLRANRYEQPNTQALLESCRRLLRRRFY